MAQLSTHAPAHEDNKLKRGYARCLTPERRGGYKKENCIAEKTHTGDPYAGESHVTRHGEMREEKNFPSALNRGHFLRKHFLHPRIDTKNFFYATREKLWSFSDISRRADRYDNSITLRPCYQTIPRASSCLKCLRLSESVRRQTRGIHLNKQGVKRERKSKERRISHHSNDGERAKVGSCQRREPRKKWASILSFLYARPHAAALHLSR